MSSYVNVKASRASACVGEEGGVAPPLLATSRLPRAGRRRQRANREKFYSSTSRCVPGDFGDETLEAVMRCARRSG